MCARIYRREVCRLLGTYNNPNTNNFGSKISIDGNAIATYAASVPSPTPTTLNLAFDNQGKATLKK